MSWQECYVAKEEAADGPESAVGTKTVIESVLPNDFPWGWEINRMQAIASGIEKLRIFLYTKHSALPFRVVLALGMP